MHPYPLFYDPSHTPRVNFFAQLKDAWDSIAYEHYRWKSPRGNEYGEPYAQSDLCLTYIRAKERQEPRPEMIKLDPLQVKILDALAEAADIPHQRGQAEIEIPEKLRPYDNIRDYVEAADAEEKKRQRRWK
jgi:hypothetical protein